MTIAVPSEKEVEYWRNFVEAWQNYTSAQRNLLVDAPSLVELICQALVSPHQRLVALDMARRLKTDQLQQLFDILLADTATNTGSGFYARELILTLPHVWHWQLSKPMWSIY
ncbi:MAG TPA: hypothetical protein VMT34_11705 [Aggregatilineales bacterium]|nr:hypothetical protein [Aggregatilineales bacterium]